MKLYRALTHVMAIAIVGITMTSCIGDNNEPETSFTTDPVEENVLYAYGISTPGVRSISDTENIVFSEENIESFNLTTREIRFKDMTQPLYERLKPFHEIEFHLGDDVLFIVSSFVGLWDSRVFDNLVLCFGHQESSTIDQKYYIYDCYPLQLSDTDAVKANRDKNEIHWETFIRYLDSKGKLTR